MKITIIFALRINDREINVKNLNKKLLKEKENIA